LLNVSFLVDEEKIKTQLIKGSFSTLRTVNQLSGVTAAAIGLSGLLWSKSMLRITYPKPNINGAFSVKLMTIMTQFFWFVRARIWATRQLR
jgi:hypothetical protein